MCRSTRRLRPLLIACPMLIALVAPHPAAAQETAPRSAAHAEDTGRREREPFRASPYVPLNHWAYPILDYWIAAGRIHSLSPFVKPYRRAEVARALRDLDEESLGGGEREWLGRLRSELSADVTGSRRAASRAARLGLELAAGAQYVTQTHRDLLRPELEGDFSDAELLEDLRLQLYGAVGPVAGGFRGQRHGIHRNDAQFPGGRVVPRLEAPLLDELSIRTEEGYLELQSRYASLFFGRMYRNWGPPNLDGFLRSDYAYSEEEIGYRIGTDRIFLIGTFASYGDFKADTTHYVSIHRLEVRPVDDLMIAVSEAAIHGGPGQQLDFGLVNPVSVWQIARTDGDPPHNKIGQLDLWWRTGLGLNVYGSFLADATNEGESCCQVGGSLGVEVAGVAPGLLLRANFTAIQSLAYRGTSFPTLLAWEEYSLERIGIGWDKVDLYLGSLEADWFPREGLWLRPKLAIQVRGEGDLRVIRPPPEELPDFPRILIGETETTIRPGVAGRWRSGSRFPVEVEWDLGLSFIQDYRNVAGDDRTEFVGTVGVLIRSPTWNVFLR